MHLAFTRLRVMVTYSEIVCVSNQFRSRLSARNEGIGTCAMLFTYIGHVIGYIPSSSVTLLVTPFKNLYRTTTDILV